MLFIRLVLLILSLQFLEQSYSQPLTEIGPIPFSNVSWDLLPPPDGQKFTIRNAHATTLFKGKIYLIGGKGQYQPYYNLDTRNSFNDVWFTEDGALWVNDQKLTGDFYVQNEDVIQPGPHAPFYLRYGHSLDAISIASYGYELMLLAGGYAPQPINDQWMSEDGNNWVYCELAPWSPRAWHRTVTFKGMLYLMGGTPLNNEIWRLESVTQIPRIAPLTRATYSNYTYTLEWRQILTNPDDPLWSPRVGMALLSQMYFNSSQTIADTRERIVLIGGFGGWPDKSDPRYDGMATRADIWTTYDGANWTLITDSAYFGNRAWMGAVVWHKDGDPTQDVAKNAKGTVPRIWIFGGGQIGSLISSPKKILKMKGLGDTYWSRDALNWHKVNFEEGGGATFCTYYSSEEWTQTKVAGSAAFLGMWGHTANYFIPKDLGEGRLLIAGGQYDGEGPFSSGTLRSREGLLCNLGGVTCSDIGICVNGTYGCDCPNIGVFQYHGGEYCELTCSRNTGVCVPNQINTDG